MHWLILQLAFRVSPHLWAGSQDINCPCESWYPGQLGFSNAAQWLELASQRKDTKLVKLEEKWHFQSHYEIHFCTKLTDA